MASDSLDRAVFSALGPIYDAAMDAARWRDALDATAAAVGGTGGALLVAEQDGNPYGVQALGSNYEPLIRSGEADYYMTELSRFEKPEWDALARQPVRRPLLDCQVWNNDITKLDSRPDYIFLREKIGVGRRIGVRLNESPAWYDAMTITFRQRQPDIPLRAMTHLEPLLPHLAKAVEMGRAFTQLRARYAAVLSVLDRVRVGLAIAIARGEVIVANAEAARILGLEDGIALSRAKRMVCRDPELTTQIQQHVAEAALTARGENDRAEALLAVQRPSGAHPFLLEIAPLSDIAGEINLGLRGALITLIDPANAPDLDVRRFARLYRLTEAETAVCEHMVAGLTGAAIAESRGTSPETVKSQMNAVLAKTGTKRRSDLIRLVVRTLPPVG